MIGNLLPTIHQEDCTAAHRLSRWALPITAECESLCDSLRFDRHIHLQQMLLIKLIECQPDRMEGVEQIAVALRIILGNDSCVLCADEPLLLHSISYLRTVFQLIPTVLPIVLWPD